VAFEIAFARENMRTTKRGSTRRSVTSFTIVATD